MSAIDFTKPETVKRLAALPYAGWAAAIIHRIDPLWGQDTRLWAVDVEVEYGCHKCDGDCCGNVGRVVEVSVEADDEREAMDRAERLHPGKFAIRAKLIAATPDPLVPEWAIKQVAA